MNWRRLERNTDIDSTHKTFIDDGDGACIYIIFSNGIPLETHPIMTNNRRARHREIYHPPDKAGLEVHCCLQSILHPTFTVHVQLSEVQSEGLS